MPRVRLDHELITRLYQDGKSAAAIAAEVGCSKPGVFHVLHLRSVPLRVGAKRGDTERKLGFKPTKEWVESLLYRSDSAKQAAEKSGLPYATFLGWMDKFGVGREPWRGGPRGGSAQRQDIPIKEAAKLSSEGVTYRKLAEKYGVSYGVVVRRMKEAGHIAPKRKQSKYSGFYNVTHSKRRVLAEIGITACQICGEDRALDYCHIVAARGGGPISADNCLVLCPTHHRLFDNTSLTDEERRKITQKVDHAYQLYGAD